MPSTDEYQSCLQNLIAALEAAGDERLAARVRPVIGQNKQTVTAFLVSNDLWGGAGSVADEAGLATSPQLKRSVESALVALGELQMKSGVTNVRTAMWTSVFRNGSKSGSDPSHPVPP